MPDIFRDDFEGGLSPFVQIITNGSLNIVAGGTVGMPALGNYCLRADTTAALIQSGTDIGEPATCNAFIRRSIPASNEVYASMRIAITQGMSNISTQDRIWFLSFSNPDGGPILRFGIRDNGGGRWTMWCRGRVVNGLDPSLWGNLITPTTEVMRFVIHYQASIGLYEVYLNEQLILSDYQPEASPFPVTQVDFGIEKPGASGTAYDPTGAYPVQAYIDALVVATEYPNDTIVSNPKVTVNVMINGVSVEGVPVTLDGTVVQYSPAVFEVTQGTHEISVPPELEL